MAVIDVDFDPEDYIDEIPTSSLREELSRRREKDGFLLSESPYHTIAELNRAFEKQDRCEFSFLVKKIEKLLEDVDCIEDAE